MKGAVRVDKPILSQTHSLDMAIRHEPQSCFQTLLEAHKHLFHKKKVLDLGCHTGVSTALVKNAGASLVIGLDFDGDAIDVAQKNFSNEQIIFASQDIERTDDLRPICGLVDIVMTFGCLYHLANHHALLKTIALPHIEYLILDSLYGPETTNPDVYVRFEQRSAREMELIPKYVPNLSWFMRQCEILGFGLDRVEKYYTTTNFRTVRDYHTNMRVCMRFFNLSKFPDKKCLTIDQVWEWKDDNLIQLAI